MFADQDLDINVGGFAVLVALSQVLFFMIVWRCFDGKSAFYNLFLPPFVDGALRCKQLESWKRVS